ncbi:hypothetical protein [Parachitinimonas caeni]|uniref:Uncharacterized protein n=1 Tax=Parachitinimonas caeni TaxID=3031301 RepID=A0ABT7DU70_9NEIS|nr:hypothetical protein [Parachitinimonas caeni]MDK2123616.1 hypothetical protein [Parachitinimonas caeni]
MNTTPDPQLPHDAELSALYRKLAVEEPATDIDDAILAASRRAVGSGPRAMRWFKSSWTAPLATAATLMVALSVALLVRDHAPSRQEQAVTLSEPPPAPAADAPAPAAAPAPASEGATPPLAEPPKAAMPNEAAVAEKPPQALQKAEKKSAPPVFSVEDAPAAASKAKDVAPAPVKPAPVMSAPAMSAPAMPAADAPPVMAAPEPVPMRDAKRDRLQEKTVAESVAPPTAASRSGAGSGADAAVPTAKPASPITSERNSTRRLLGATSTESAVDEASPEQWANRIRKLINHGEHKAAREELDKLRKRYPDWSLPPDLAEFSKEAP